LDIPENGLELKKTISDCPKEENSKKNLSKHPAFYLKGNCFTFRPATTGHEDLEYSPGYAQSKTPGDSYTLPAPK